MTRERNVILTGFMGTGKSVVGKQLAARLGCKFIDTDVLIEQEEGVPITRIFAEKGEPYFRELEKQVIARVCQEKGLVLATGGGTMLNETNVAQLKESGTVICLAAAPEVILKRVRGTEDRPLLQGGDPLAKIHNLLAVRAEAYAKADVTVDTSRLTVGEVVEAVIAALGKDLET